MSRWYRLSPLALMLVAVWVCGMVGILEAQVGPTTAQGKPTPGRFTKAHDGVITDRRWLAVAHHDGVESPLPEGGLAGPHGPALSNSRGLGVVRGFV